MYSYLQSHTMYSCLAWNLLFNQTCLKGAMILLPLRPEYEIKGICYDAWFDLITFWR